MKISSLLREAEKPNQGTVNQLPIDRDLIYQARNKYPGYSPEQAMILLISDEMKNQEKTDSVQNRLIDTQKRENERLRGLVNDLGQTVEQEIEQVAQQAEINDREIEKIKQLSGTLSTGGEETTRKAKLSAEDLEKLQSDLEMLKTKPGMDPEKFKQLEQQIKLMASNPSANNADLSKINSLLDTLNKQKEIGDDLYKKVENQLAKTQEELDKKENRFKGYIDKKKSEVGTMQKTHADEIKNYADIVKDYQKEITKFDSELNKMKSEKDIIYDLRANIMQDAEKINKDATDISKMKNDVSKKLDFINKHIQKITNTDSSPTDVADVPWLMGGARKTQNTQQTQNMPTNVQESIIYTEGYTPAPSRQYRNTKYNEWITKHFLGLFNLFKGRYAKDLREKGYSDKQIADTLEEYIPLLYNLGNDKTPLTPDEVIPWAENVKDKLWELPAQQEMFNESLDKTYARMLDDIIGLAYIKKG